MTRRVIAAAAIAGAIVCAYAAPAFAHVSIDPPSVPKGSTVKLSFLVPNEEPAKKTTEVKIVFPGAPNAIPSVSVEPKPGWKFTITTQHLTTPIKTDDGDIADVVSAIDWKATTNANGIGKDEFGEFTIDADGIPTNTSQLVFKAVQTYSDGSVVAWVDPVTPNGPAADHPTPILQLTSGDQSGNGSTPTTTGGSSGIATVVASSTKDNSARALGVVGIILGAVALVFGTGALMRKRRS